MKYFWLVFAALLLLPLAVQAKDTPPAVPRVQAQAFALGHALHTADLRAAAFTLSVRSLQNVEDDNAAGAEVAHLSRSVGGLRQQEAEAYTQVSTLLTQMHAPPTLRNWAAESARTLSAPLFYSKDAKAMQKAEPDTAATLAELEEIQKIKAAANTLEPSLLAWMKLTGGAAAVWSADVGGYAADLHAASSGRQIALPVGAARALLTRVPADVPAVSRETLAGMVPSGGGNLQALAPLSPSVVSSARREQVYRKLLDIYEAQKFAERLDKAAG